MKKFAFLFVLSFLLVVPFFSWAHPGHGETDGYSIIHYFVEPMHAVVSYSALIVSFLYIRNMRKKARANKNL